MIEGTILLVGCGKMGCALLSGWFAKGLSPVDVMVVEPAGRDHVTPCQDHPALPVVSEASDVPSDFQPDVVVFAVKPQVMPDVAKQYARFAEMGTVFMSIAAGLSIANMQAWLGEKAAIVRAMPNTPAAVGEGITVLCPSEATGPTQKRVCKILMSAVGETAWIDDEALMDAVTGVSGSGPAYVFLLAETLAQAGVAAGLPEELAVKLARKTVSGSGALLRDDPTPAGTLRENVTSKGGTTAAALDVLMADPGMKDLLERAVAAAVARSKDLRSN